MILNTHYTLLDDYSKPYLLFTSSNSFRIRINSGSGWDGVLEYSINAINWQTVEQPDSNSITLNSSIDGRMYFRGTGNTYFTQKPGAMGEFWVYVGSSDVSIIGNIENLLDYQTVQNGQHPIMGSFCFNTLFSDWNKLIKAPVLPATTLSAGCYARMFRNCTSLTKAPVLPATILPETPEGYVSCYDGMFSGCSSLIKAPKLPATTLSKSCYSGMFYACTSLIEAPELPATVLAERCYEQMFVGCSSLTKGPSLPATTAKNYCYYNMFQNCTSLRIIPYIRFTELIFVCCAGMFENCSNVRVSDSSSLEYSNQFMLVSSITDSGSSRMLTGTGGTFTGNPVANVTYYTSNPVV